MISRCALVPLAVYHIRGHVPKRTAIEAIVNAAFTEARSYSALARSGGGEADAQA
jgi:hypothetical protein